MHREKSPTRSDQRGLFAFFAFLLPSSPPLRLRLRNRAWGRTPLAVYKPGIRVTNAMAKLPPGWGTSCPYPLLRVSVFIPEALHDGGWEKGLHHESRWARTHEAISAKGTGPWSSLTHIKNKEIRRRKALLLRGRGSSWQSLPRIRTEGRSSSLTSTLGWERESPPWDAGKGSKRRIGVVSRARG